MTYTGIILPFPHLYYVWRTDYCVRTGLVLGVHLCNAAIFFFQTGIFKYENAKMNLPGIFCVRSPVPHLISIV